MRYLVEYRKVHLWLHDQIELRIDGRQFTNNPTVKPRTRSTCSGLIDESRIECISLADRKYWLAVRNEYKRKKYEIKSVSVAK